MVSIFRIINFRINRLIRLFPYTIKLNESIKFEKINLATIISSFLISSLGIILSTPIFYLHFMYFGNTNLKFQDSDYILKLYSKYSTISSEENTNRRKSNIENKISEQNIDSFLESLDSIANDNNFKEQLINNKNKLYISEFFTAIVIITNLFIFIKTIYLTSNKAISLWNAFKFNLAIPLLYYVYKFLGLIFPDSLRLDAILLPGLIGLTPMMFYHVWALIPIIYVISRGFNMIKKQEFPNI